MGAAISDEFQDPEEFSNDEDDDITLNDDQDVQIVTPDLSNIDDEEDMSLGLSEITDDLPKPGVIKVRVDKVNFDGLVRTNDVVIEDMVKELYEVDNYEDLCLKSSDIRNKLAGLGCFRNIEIYIDNSSGVSSTPNGVEVLYVVKELPLINYEVNSMFGQNNGTFSVVANVRNLLGRGDKILFKSTISSMALSNFTLTFSKPFPNAAFQPTLNIHFIKESNMKNFSERKALVDLALRANKRTHTVQLEGGDGSVLEEAFCCDPVSSSLYAASGIQKSSTCKFAARHIVSLENENDVVQNMKGNISKFISELLIKGRGIDREAVVKNFVDLERVLRLHENAQLQVNARCGVHHRLPLKERRDLDKYTLSRASSLFWHIGLDLSLGLPFLLTIDKFKEFFKNNSLVPHFFIQSGGDGFISADRDLSCNIHNVSENTQVTGGFGVKLRIGELANVELNYYVPLWIPSQADRYIAPGLQFGLGWKFL